MRRGATFNPHNKFVAHERERDPEYIPFDEEEEENPRTKLWPDNTRKIIATNKSPDISFDSSINPYRGCEHGCAYCYARPGHEYLGFSAGIDFEQNILIKENAPALLREALSKKSWKPQVLAISGVTDPYQPLEKRLRLTRGCLEVLLDFRNPVQMITKNALIVRDLDLLQGLNEFNCIRVSLSITTLRPELARVMEPRAASPARRLAAVEKLSSAGIPVNVMMAPMIPGLNEHEIPALMKAAADAGARSAMYLPIRLPLTVEPVFLAWLEEHFPDRKDKIVHKILSLRSGKMHDSTFFNRFVGDGEEAALMANLYKIGLLKSGLGEKFEGLTTEHFRVPPSKKGEPEQLELF